MQAAPNTVDPAEVAKFEAMAAEWWDPKGKFKPLHMLNPCRLDYLTSQIAGEFDRDLTTQEPFKGLRILDIGCGGGLLSEPMARLGATVVGADAAERNIPDAQVHAEQSGLTIDYRNTTAEAMADAGEQFDVVINMEVVEHVANPLAYLTACQQLLKPGGFICVPRSIAIQKATQWQLSVRRSSCAGCQKARMNGISSSHRTNSSNSSLNPASNP